MKGCLGIYFNGIPGGSGDSPLVFVYPIRGRQGELEIF